MSRRSFRIALIVVLGSLAVAAAVAGVMVKRVLDYPETRPTVTAGAGPIRVAIDPGMSFPRIAARLTEAGAIDRPRWFRIYGMIRGVTTKVKPGAYSLEPGLTPEQVLDRLLEGVPDVTAAVKVPEGLNMLEVFAIVEAAGVARAAELEAVARDPGFLGRQGITGDTVDGYLFPETYKMKVPSSPERVLETMIKQHRIVWDQIRREKGPAIAKLQRQLGWSDREILTMASIVEKEAVVDEERPRIAQVFINRLIAPGFAPRRLDTDPTIRYGCTVPKVKSAGCASWSVTDRLRRAQLDDVDNPYNTYQHEGLPPGPIGNPGERSLRATVEPDGSGYFYFVARSQTDKRHFFAKTRAEHEANVAKYLEH